MDFLKSCYKSNMRLYRERPDILTPGRWHWSPPGAVMVPFPHAFASQYWDEETAHVNPSVGEVKGNLGGCNGFAEERYTGQNVCGSEFIWQHGSLYAQLGTPEVDDDGIPVCCQAVAPGPGGVDLGGDAGFIFLKPGAVLGDRSREVIKPSAAILLGDRTPEPTPYVFAEWLDGDRSVHVAGITRGGFSLGDRTIVAAIINAGFGGFRVGDRSTGAADPFALFAEWLDGDRTLRIASSGRDGFVLGDRSKAYTIQQPVKTGLVLADRSHGAAAPFDLFAEWVDGDRSFVLAGDPAQGWLLGDRTATPSLQGTTLSGVVFGDRTRAPLNPVSGLVLGDRSVANPGLTIAGLQIGDRSFQPISACSNCTTGASLNYSTTLSGFSGLMTGFNGTHVLVWQGGSFPCLWAVLIPGPLYINLYKRDGYWEALFFSSLVGVEGGYLETVPSTTCLTPFTMSKYLGDARFPPSIAFSPV